MAVMFFMFFKIKFCSLKAIVQLYIENNKINKIKKINKNKKIKPEPDYVFVQFTDWKVIKDAVFGDFEL